MKDDMMTLAIDFLGGCFTMKYFKSTFLTLSLKVLTLSNLNQYKLIAYINVIHKTIEKMLADIVTHALPYLISKD